MVALFSLENGGMTDYATGNLHQHESSLFRCLWPQLDPGDIVLGDRAFCSYGSLAMLQAQGNDGVFRLHQKRRIDFREGKRLGADDRLLVWSKPEQRPAGLTPEQYAALPATLEVRMVRLKVAATGNGPAESGGDRFSQPVCHPVYHANGCGNLSRGNFARALRATLAGGTERSEIASRQAVRRGCAEAQSNCILPRSRPRWGWIFCAAKPRH